MFRKGHYGVSLLVTAPLGLALVLGGQTGVAVTGGAGVLWLAMLPDVDVRIPGVPHRGPTHSLGFAALVGAALGGAVLLVGRPLGLAEPVGVAAFAAGVGVVGVCAHLAGDLLTPSGVPLFWPLGGSYSLSVTTADSTVWNYGLFALGVGAAAATALVALRFG